MKITEPRFLLQKLLKTLEIILTILKKKILRIPPVVLKMMTKFWLMMKKILIPNLLIMKLMHLIQSQKLRRTTLKKMMKKSPKRNNNMNPWKKENCVRIRFTKKKKDRNYTIYIQVDFLQKISVKKFHEKL